jgi:preprotein translocase SecE subunit
MAVAVKNTPESSTRTALGGLVPASILGAVFVLGCAAILFWGVPQIWWTGWDRFLGLFGDPVAVAKRLSFVGGAGLIAIEIIAIILLAMLGMTLAGPTPPRGLRAGVFSVLVWLFAAGFVTYVVGRLCENFLPGARAAGAGLTIAVGIGLLYWGFSLFSRPRAQDKVRAFEDQGWFTAQRLKPMQGQRVRRATMLGIILLVGAGIYSLYNHGTLNTVDRNWSVVIPFTNYVQPLLPDVKYTLPLLIVAAGLWLAFRVVHLPVFADFLIATEAELNKVSWPTRKSVVQDTIVVLTTVLMLTVFLFLVDMGWGWLLSRDVVGVIRQSDAPKTANQQTNVEKIPY